MNHETGPESESRGPPKSIRNWSRKSIENLSRNLGHFASIFESSGAAFQKFASLCIDFWSTLGPQNTSSNGPWSLPANPSKITVFQFGSLGGPWTSYRFPFIFSVDSGVHFGSFGTRQMDPKLHQNLTSFWQPILAWFRAFLGPKSDLNSKAKSLGFLLHFFFLLIYFL